MHQGSHASLKQRCQRTRSNGRGSGVRVDRDGSIAAATIVNVPGTRRSRKKLSDAITGPNETDKVSTSHTTSRLDTDKLT